MLPPVPSPPPQLTWFTWLGSLAIFSWLTWCTCQVHLVYLVHLPCSAGLPSSVSLVCSPDSLGSIQKFMSGSTGVVDFVVLIMDSVYCLLDGQAIFWWNLFSLRQFKLQ